MGTQRTLAILVAAAGLAALGLTGCASAASADPVGTWGDPSDGSPYLALSSDGRLTGSDGCNRLMGGWEATDDGVTFTDVASTRMACADVDTWLSGLGTAKIAGDTMKVKDAEGHVLGTLDKSSATAAPTPTASATDVVGTWGDPSVKDKPSLVFSEDGRVSGTDGCNVLGGDWSAEGPTVTFDQVFMTQVYCEDIDTWLSGMATATVDGDTLSLFDKEGAPIGILERTE